MHQKIFDWQLTAKYLHYKYIEIPTSQLWKFRKNWIVTGV